MDTLRKCLKMLPNIRLYRIPRTKKIWLFRGLKLRLLKSMLGRLTNSSSSMSQKSQADATSSMSLRTRFNSWKEKTSKEWNRSTKTLKPKLRVLRSLEVKTRLLLKTWVASLSPISNFLKVKRMKLSVTLKSLSDKLEKGKRSTSRNRKWLKT
jgi:hypothetical protein